MNSHRTESRNREEKYKCGLIVKTKPRSRLQCVLFLFTGVSMRWEGLCQALPLLSVLLCDIFFTFSFRIVEEVAGGSNSILTRNTYLY